ncbi:hypothetical protein [Undibacterium sp.]|uniref:hypothetical protein n=1 Tax=Undibacterium sp. TaxID=1914977 RepID=UPI0027313822|nr:hypothetical protein [Undibacterium sp.]MDP1978663.1 hypothetical protein [Undibacterium sp.]
MEKEGPLFERSEFRDFPFFVLHKRESPLGGDDAWVAFLAYLFGEAKRYVAAGLPPAGNPKLRVNVLQKQMSKTRRI